MTDRANVCRRCEYFDDDDGLGFGLCRVDAPQPEMDMIAEQLPPLPGDDSDEPHEHLLQTPDMRSTWRGRWPSVAADDWCGKFKRRTRDR